MDSRCWTVPRISSSGRSQIVVPRTPVILWERVPGESGRRANLCSFPEDAEERCGVKSVVMLLTDYSDALSCNKEDTSLFQL